MTEQELDAMLKQPLPERDAREFSVTLMEAIAQFEARAPRILAWLMLGILSLVIAAACAFVAKVAGRADFGAQSLAVPCALILLTLLLSFAALQSVRE
jgi:hypothetical protein